MQKNRESNLDILRGLMASGVMIYHFFLFSHIPPNYNLFINKIGFYGVSVFYILSGTTFYIVYRNTNFLELANLKNFWIKRFFRIFPLFWLVSIASLIILKNKANFEKIFLNFSGFFSIIKPDAYISIGGWSIGNELFFYMIFPILLIAIQKRKTLFGILLISAFALFVFFAFFNINSNQDIESQWSKYINPLNQVFFFAGGILIGFLYKKFQIPQIIAIICAIILCISFAWYPIEVNKSVEIVAGFNRLAFSFIALLFTYFFIQIKLPHNFFKRFLEVLGEISYSIYLAHPIIFFLNIPIFKVLSKFVEIPLPIKICLLIVETFVICWFCYQYFEKKFINFGNELIQKNRSLVDISS